MCICLLCLAFIIAAHLSSKILLPVITVDISGKFLQYHADHVKSLCAAVPETVSFRENESQKCRRAGREPMTSGVADKCVRKSATANRPRETSCSLLNSGTVGTTKRLPHEVIRCVATRLSSGSSVSTLAPQEPQMWFTKSIAPRPTATCLVIQTPARHRTVRGVVTTYCQETHARTI